MISTATWAYSLDVRSTPCPDEDMEELSNIVQEAAPVDYNAFETLGLRFQDMPSDTHSPPSVISLWPGTPLRKHLSRRTEISLNFETTRLSRVGFVSWSSSSVTGYGADGGTKPSLWSTHLRSPQRIPSPLASQ